VLYFVQAFPKLRATLSGALEQVIGVAVFGSDDCCPDRSGVLIKLPNPFGQQGDVHLFGVEQA
jgi:hypothetical protein